MTQTPSGFRRGLPRAAAGVPVPADKRFRRSDVRQGRRNWRRVFVRTAWLGGGLLVALALVAWLGSVLVRASVLKVDRFVLTGNAWVTRADVDKRLEGLMGESVLSVDLEQYHQRLLENKWVKTAELWRVLPSTVQVRIVERKPLAIARLDGQLFLVDAEGVIDRFGPQYRQFDLPVVDGLMTETPDGPVVDPGRSRLVTRLFRELFASPDVFSLLSQVNVSDPTNVVALVEGEPAELWLGDQKFLERVQRWREVKDRTREQVSVTEHWDLRFDGDRFWVK
jgi:hypothetical protein